MAEPIQTTIFRLQNVSALLRLRAPRALMQENDDLVWGKTHTRQCARHERIDQKCNKIISNVNEELMPAFSFISRVNERDYSDDELRTEETSRSDKGDPSGGVDPACNPGKERYPSFPTDYCDPVVLTSCCWVCGEEFGE